MQVYGKKLEVGRIVGRISDTLYRVIGRKYEEVICCIGLLIQNGRMQHSTLFRCNDEKKRRPASLMYVRIKKPLLV